MYDWRRWTFQTRADGPGKKETDQMEEDQEDSNAQ